MKEYTEYFDFIEKIEFTISTGPIGRYFVKQVVICPLTTFFGLQYLKGSRVPLIKRPYLNPPP